ncbi:MAG: MraY family glycosyltransferase [Bacillota bacterium]
MTLPLDRGMLLVLLCTFLGALLITPLVKKFAVSIGAIDQPNSRKVHTVPIPRLGGLGIFCVFAAALLLTQPIGRQETGLLVGCAIIVIAGVLDDIRELRPRTKLAAQIAAAVVVTYFGVRVEVISQPFGGVFHLGYFAIPVTVLWIIGVTNAINLIDGLDGLAAGTAVIAAVTMAAVAGFEGRTLVAGFALILAAAVLGFLPYNFSPARIFMGDSGSMFLGFTLATLAIQGLTKGATFISIFIPVIILGIPIFDTLFAIVRRYKNHRPIFEADKGHLHHRLLGLGLSQRQTVVAIYFVNAFLGISAIVLNILSTEHSIVALITLATLILIFGDRIKPLGRRILRFGTTAPKRAKDFHHSG